MGASVRSEPNVSSRLVLSEAEMARCIETFNTMPPLRVSFPVTLSNGASVHTVRGVCSKCSQDIATDDVHGRVTWPIATVAVVAAAGLCRACSTMTQLYLRLRPTGTTYRAEAPRLDGRGWIAVQAPPQPWWRRLRRWLLRAHRVSS